MSRMALSAHTPRTGIRLTGSGPLDQAGLADPA
jgi:hypothetical protein